MVNYKTDPARFVRETTKQWLATFDPRLPGSMPPNHWENYRKTQANVHAHNLLEYHGAQKIAKLLKLQTTDKEEVLLALAKHIHEEFLKAEKTKPPKKVR
ncbi:MAG TPA: hypothetical protein VGQ00_03725 [Candidatus Norongarragalinales archaeon]|jgi:hypothetical protein|nr:hypothetical protein [Candidatus Norongarragalinales archaeon]